MTELPVTAAWMRIEAWYEAQGISDLLNPGVQPDVLAEAKSECGLELPADLEASLLRHNGSEGLSGWPGGELLSVQRMIESWAILSSALSSDDEFADEHADEDADEVVSGAESGRVKPGWWRDGWQPIVANHGRLFLLADLDPDEQGTVGQIIGFSSDGGPTDALAPSFTAYLQSIADDLESGDAYVEGTDILGTSWD